jgi:prevent-host-death family protein
VLVSSTELQNNLGKYLELASEQEVVITRNGKPIARLVGFHSDNLIGIIPPDVDEKAAREERLSKQ